MSRLEAPTYWTTQAKVSLGFALILPLLWVFITAQYTVFNFDPTLAKNVPAMGPRLTFGETPYWYLCVNVATIIFPLLLSFDKKVHFYTHWKRVWPAIFIVGIFFLAWDVYFTHLGVWGFNPRYYSLSILGLPLGEYLFFLTVPYACMFIYGCLVEYFPRDILKPFDQAIGWTLVVLFAGMGIWQADKIYTSWTFLLGASFLAWHLRFVPNHYRSRFYMTYFISILPFTLVNGILTGGFNKEPVVLYNDMHNLTSVLGFRFGSIPFDDFAYSFLMLFMVMSLYRR